MSTLLERLQTTAVPIIGREDYDRAARHIDALLREAACEIERLQTSESAAPDLLEALENFVEIQSRLVIPRGGDLQVAMVRARAAIAKARGTA